MGGEDSAAACSPSVSHSAMIVARMPSSGRPGGAARVGHSEQQSKRGGRLLVCLYVHCAISAPASSRFYLYFYVYDCSTFTESDKIRKITCKASVN